MKKIRITVIRKVCHTDLIAKYENPIEHACDMQEGQVFIANGWKKRKNFPMIGKNFRGFSNDWKKSVQWLENFL